MNATEKKCYLLDNHMGEWLKTRNYVENHLSDSNPMVCYCGRLATGFHERGCRKFQSKVDAETIKMLKYLIPKGGKAQ